MKANTKQGRAFAPKSSSGLADARALHKHMQRRTARRTAKAQQANPVATPPLTPQEVLAKLRADKPPVPTQPPVPGPKSLNELIAEGRARNEKAYCDELRAHNKAVYTPDDAVKLGYKLNPAWTQRDLQGIMLCGPVLMPLMVLKKQAEESFQTFVVPGRKAVLGIMARAYELFCVAMEPTRADAVFDAIRGKVESLTKRKLAEDVSNGALFVRFVFAEFDDRKVHLYSRALDYAYACNVGVSDFEAWVQKHGGWEAIRKEANTALLQSPAVQAAKLAKESKRKDDEALMERWEKLRGVIDSVHPGPKLSKALGRQPGRFLIEVTWLPDHHPAQDVYGGNFDVEDVIPWIDEVGVAMKKYRLQAAESEGDGLLKAITRMEAAKTSQTPESR